MPETGTSILSYRGDPNLGLGANASIPAINSKADLDTINQIGRDILMINHDNNIRLYQQKVKDRDDTLQMIADGQIPSGNIDPSDRKYYDEAKKAATDDFYEMIKNGGLNNPDAVRKYRESVTNLKNVATWAQHRELGLAQLDKEAAEQTLPEDVEAYKKLKENAKKLPFWNQIPIHQKAFNYDINSSIAEVTGQPITESEIGTMSSSGSPMGVTQWNSVTDKNGVITQKQTTKTSPLRSAQITAPKGKGVTTTGTQVNSDGTLSEISYTPEKYWDLETIQQNVSELSASNPTARYTYHSWLNDVETKLPEDRKLALLVADNNRIAEYSRARGIEPIGTNPDGSPIYPDQVKFFSDPVSKQTHIQETPESFFAKHSLASIKGDYVEQGQRVFDDKIAKHNIELKKLGLLTAESKAKIGALRALESERYSKSNLNYKKSKAVDNQFNPKQVFDELFTGKMETVQTKDGNTVTRVNSANLSKELQDVLGIAPLNANGDYNLNPANIKFNGKQIDESLIWKGYPNWLKSPQAKKIQQETDKIPSVFDYIYSQGGDFEVEVQGKTKPKLNKYGIDEGGGGKIIRSNRLQSYINQMNAGGVKGKELIKLLSDDEGNINEQTEEFNSSKETGSTKEVGNANNPQ